MTKAKATPAATSADTKRVIAKTLKRADELLEQAAETRKADEKAKAVVAQPDTPAPRKEAAGIVKRTSGFTADPRQIGRKPGHNPRFDFGEIEELAKSIVANGLLQDLRVKRWTAAEAELSGGKAFYIIDGDRRLTAIELLLSKGHEFPEGVGIKIVDKAQSELDDLFQMFESNTGKPFLPLEEAAAYKRMRDGSPEDGIKGLTIKQICERVGRKQVHVVATLALLDADESVQAAVKDGSINSTTAKNIAVHARGDKAKQAELTQQAKDAGKSKTGKQAVKRAIDDARRDKAAKRGKTVKMRALSDAELSALGSSVAASMADKMRDAGKDLDTDLRAWVKADDKLALAAAFGALEALKAAAGVATDLVF